jgi:hypothetical protein
MEDVHQDSYEVLKMLEPHSGGQNLEAWFLDFIPHDNTLNNSRL